LNSAYTGKNKTWLTDGGVDLLIGGRTGPEGTNPGGDYDGDCKDNGHVIKQLTRVQVFEIIRE
jgi:hypothetical protein